MTREQLDAMQAAAMRRLRKSPCRKCGGMEATPNGARCKTCSDEYQKARRENNKESIAKTKKVYRNKNKEAIRVRLAAKRAANPELERERYRLWKEANPEKKKASDAAWLAKNKSKAQAKNRAWVEKNADRHKDRCAKWRKENPDSRRTLNQNRRARKRNAPGKLSVGLADKLFSLQKGKCPCCRLPLGDNYHLDHIIPLFRGGSNSDDNMQLLRARCNLSKRAKDPVEYMQEKGFLL